MLFLASSSFICRLPTQLERKLLKSGGHVLYLLDVIRDNVRKFLLRHLESIDTFPEEIPDKNGKFPSQNQLGD